MGFFNKPQKRNNMQKSELMKRICEIKSILEIQNTIYGGVSGERLKQMIEIHESSEKSWYGLFKKLYNEISGFDGIDDIVDCLINGGYNQFLGEMQRIYGFCWNLERFSGEVDFLIGLDIKFKSFKIEKRTKETVGKYHSLIVGFMKSFRPILLLLDGFGISYYVDENFELIWYCKDNNKAIQEADKELNEKPTIEERAEEEIKVIDKLKEEIKNDNFWKVLDNATNTGFVEKMENGAYEWKGTERELAYFSESAYNNGFVKYKFSTIEKLFAKDKGCLTKSNWKSIEFVGAVKKGQEIDKLFII